MVKRSDIRSYVRDVVAMFHPERVILFGSHAHGRPSEHSDVDLLVVMASDSGEKRTSLEIRQRLHAGFPLDLLVRTPEKIQERAEMNDPFICEILERGIVLYEADHAGVGIRRRATSIAH